MVFFMSIKKLRFNDDKNVDFFILQNKELKNKTLTVVVSSIIAIRILFNKKNRIEIKNIIKINREFIKNSSKNSKTSFSKECVENILTARTQLLESEKMERLLDKIESLKRDRPLP